MGRKRSKEYWRRKKQRWRDKQRLQRIGIAISVPALREQHEIEVVKKDGPEALFRHYGFNKIEPVGSKDDE